MAGIDWFIVIALNLLIFGYASIRSLKTHSDVDWFLAGRTLPFWLIGLSMFATSVDGGEYVAVNGATYQDGLVMFTGVVFGVGVGGMIAAHVVMPNMYRAGLFTNAEYLEHRFGISARIISVLVQIQYRTATLATIAVALHLMLTEVAALPSHSAWILIVGLTAATTLYAAWGGLKTIAAADVLLGALMLLSTLVLWSVIWQEAGGWAGTQAALVGQLGEREAQELLHIGSQGDASSHPIVVVIGWCLIATGYFVVNHTQTMKMFGARSLWDLKMSVVAGTALIILSGYFSSSLGLLGRALVPGLSNPDLIYPRLVDQYLVTGLKGIVVAGMIASAVSTFEGIGVALSALFTRDIYARLLVPDRDDRHYVIVSRMATVFIVAITFFYVPFILRAQNIVEYFVGITSIFVTPLMTVYLVGSTTRVDRRAGLVGLIAGPAFRLSVVALEVHLSLWLTDNFVAYLWTTGVTGASMLIASIILSIVSPAAAQRTAPMTTRPSGWLARSQGTVREIASSPFPGGVPWWASPALWAAAVLSTSGYVVFVVLW